MHEFEIINKYFSNLTKFNRNALNLNDDVFFDKKKQLVISVDTYHQGYHFFNFDKPDQVIKKVIRASISDLICKGVKPKYYFISASGNKNTFSKKNLLAISKSIKEDQRKFNIHLCGGDTTYSNKLSFTIMSLGYSKRIIYRNKTKLNDDIYVTGNLGDSYIGLQILKKKISLTGKVKKYFLKKYYQPDLKINVAKQLLSFANSSIDISDGLIADLEKLINNQNYSYKIDIEKIPISKNLSNLIKSFNFKKTKLISNGDDYQVLFTASPSKSRIIQKKSLINGLKITKIGKIISGKVESSIIDPKGKQILVKNKGYIHQF